MAARRRIAPALVAALLFGLVLLRPGAAQAHAALIEAWPSEGAVLDQAPRAIRLRFDEAVTLLNVTLVDADGRARADVVVSARDDTITLVPPALPRGTQIVSYRVISADGHPVGGTIAFSVGAAGNAAAPRDVGHAARDAAIWLARLLLYVGLVGGGGGAFFLAWVARTSASRPLRRALTALLVGGGVGAVVSWGLQGLDMGDAPFLALLSPAPWQMGGQTPFAATLGLAAAALLLSALALRRSPRAASAVALAMTGAAFAVSGHASLAVPQALMRPAVFLHVVTATFWGGALLPLALLSAQRAPTLAPALRRFSIAAFTTVAAQVAAGALLAFVQFRGPIPPFETPYGAIFVAKMLGVAMLLALAAWNAFVLSPALRRGLPGTQARLARSVFVECAVYCGVLALVAGWRLTPPPRAAAAPIVLHLHGEAVMAQVAVMPGRVGANRVDVQVYDGDGVSMVPQEVTITLAPDDGTLQPRASVARHAGETWTGDAFLAVPGPWSLSVTVRVTDFDQTRLTGGMAIRP